MEQRKNIAKKKRSRPRDHVTHHVTHVIDDGADGTRKSHVHAKTIKSPVLPYNKWDTAQTANAANSAHMAAFANSTTNSGNGLLGSPLTVDRPLVIGDVTMCRQSSEPPGVVDIEVSSDDRSARAVRTC